MLQREILNKLSKEILSGNVKKDSVVETVLKDSEIGFENVEVEIPKV